MTHFLLNFLKFFRWSLVLATVVVYVISMVSLIMTGKFVELFGLLIIVSLAAAVFITLSEKMRK